MSRPPASINTSEKAHGDGLIELDSHIVISKGTAPPASQPRGPVLRWLTYLFLLPLILIATIGFGCVSLLCGLWDTTGSQQHAVARTWARTLLRIGLSPVTVRGREHLTANKRLSQNRRSRLWRHRLRITKKNPPRKVRPRYNHQSLKLL